MRAQPTDNSSKPKIVTVVGPECTGKTDLSTFLAAHFQTVWVPEYARAYLDKLHHPYDVADLTKIAHGQLRLEDEWMGEANKVLICDTNLLVIKVWSEFKFGICDPEILRIAAGRNYDLILLTNIDVPWQNDPLREHPDKRAHFMDIYRKETAATGVPVVEISGSREQRQARAVDSIQNLLSNA
jgi:NadR type nicotinamide-nucleotide adenylyltransferase